MAKQIVTAMRRGRAFSEGSIAGERGEGDPRAARTQRDPREKLWSPTITKDGVTVAKEIELRMRSRTWAPRW